LKETIKKKAMDIPGRAVKIRRGILGDDAGIIGANLLVKEFLTDEGVSEDKLEAVGYGPDKPIASNRTRKGRAKNRRVEFKIEQ